MAIENLKTKEFAQDSDMDISDIDEHGYIYIEAVKRNVFREQYTRILIDKQDANIIINHLKQQFGL